MDMDHRTTYRPRPRENSPRGTGGVRLTACLLLAAAAVAGRLYFPEGVARAADVVFGTEDGAVRAAFAGFTDDLAERGAAEAFSALYGVISGRAEN